MSAQTLLLEIDGMHCDACVRRATAALTRAGVGTVGEIRIGAAEVHASAESGPVLVAALEKAGFTARVRSEARHARSSQ